MIDGLGRVARAENDKLVLVVAALDTENTSIGPQVANICRIEHYSSIVAKLSGSLSMLQDNIDLAKPMHSYGVDALLAIDLRT